MIHPGGWNTCPWSSWTILPDDAGVVWDGMVWDGRKIGKICCHGGREDTPPKFDSELPLKALEGWKAILSDWGGGFGLFSGANC